MGDLLAAVLLLEAEKGEIVVFLGDEVKRVEFLKDVFVSLHRKVQIRYNRRIRRRLKTGKHIHHPIRVKNTLNLYRPRTHPYKVWMTQLQPRDLVLPVNPYRTRLSHLPTQIHIIRAKPLGDQKSL